MSHFEVKTKIINNYKQRSYLKFVTIFAAIILIVSELQHTQRYTHQHVFSKAENLYCDIASGLSLFSCEQDFLSNSAPLTQPRSSFKEAYDTLLRSVPTTNSLTR